MSLSTFFNNLRYLFRYNLKDIYKCSAGKLNDELIIEQILYELPNSNVFRPKIKNYEETIDKLISSNCSIARFGDGEIAIINGNDIPFQKYNKNLAIRLKEILQNSNKDLLVGINYNYYYPEIDKLLSDVASFYRNSVAELRRNLSLYLDKEKFYYSAAITQLYMFFKEYDFENYYNKFRTVWNNRKILIVSCSELINNVRYNIFDNASEIAYFQIPSKNAYENYKKIYSSIKKYERDTLVILMAGPTAKVLADDLSKDGYRALDLGHLMKDYDWYKRKINRNYDNLMRFTRPD